MKRWMRLTMVGLALTAAGQASAQAPAGAPAGAGGICKDGTYSMQANKDGACRGHKGVQTWYLASTPKMAKGSMTTPSAPMPAPTPAPMPAPAPLTPSQPMQAAPAPAPMPTQPAAAQAPQSPAGSMPAKTPSTRKGPGAAAAARTQAPGGGPGLVWVNTASNVYHCNGDEFYGKTKAGAYMSEADAKAKGAHGERGKVCTGK